MNQIDWPGLKPPKTFERGDETMTISEVIVKLGIARNKADASAFVRAGAVKMDLRRVTDPALRVSPRELKGCLLQVGRHVHRCGLEMDLVG